MIYHFSRPAVLPVFSISTQSSICSLKPKTLQSTLILLSLSSLYTRSISKFISKHIPNLAISFHLCYHDSNASHHHHSLDVMHRPSDQYPVQLLPQSTCHVSINEVMAFHYTWYNIPTQYLRLPGLATAYLSNTISCHYPSHPECTTSLTPFLFL